MSAPDVVLTFYSSSGAVGQFNWPEGWPMPRVGENVFAMGEVLKVFCLNWSPESGHVEVRCDNVARRLDSTVG